jgi:hypothetical protein
MGKKEIIIASAVLLLSFGTAFYAAMQDRWGFTNSPLAEVYQSYNQGRTEYSLKQYPAAEKTWLSALIHEQADEQITRRSLFNLGSNAFQESLQSENSDDLKTAIEQTEKSILRYRDLLSRLSSTDIPDYPDAEHNLAIARLRLKFLTEKHKNQKQQDDQQKDPYQLLNEIIQTEQQIQTLLGQLSSSSSPGEKNKLREILIKLQKQNTARIESLKNSASTQHR